MVTAISPEAWPRTLTAELAAEYLGCRSAGQFRREVAAGIWPQPLLKQSRPQRWSIQELERALRPDRGGKANSALASLERRLGIADEAPEPVRGPVRSLGRG
ncbi:hypothetical protein GGE65_008263 [Skermanella aerolata]|uniref:hypothetical protein n=1 Tax=Skermanella aerolata TaxID=393310 RepID=UPI003D25849A